jgi:hypothetical protein
MIKIKVFLDDLINNLSPEGDRYSYESWFLGDRFLWG